MANYFWEHEGAFSIELSPDAYTYHVPKNGVAITENIVQVQDGKIQQFMGGMQFWVLKIPFAWGYRFIRCIRDAQGNILWENRDNPSVQKLLGYDTFAGEEYALEPAEGVETEAKAQELARQRLEKLEKDQPTSQSGGQGSDGIQDQVFIVRPDGTKYRFTDQLMPTS